MKHLTSFLLFFVILFTSCFSTAAVGAEAAASVAAPQPSADPLVAQTVPVILFGIGMHIEPFGAQASSLAGAVLQAEKNGRKPSYFTREFYNHHVQDIRLVAGIIERHGGRMTVGAQTPFTQVTSQGKNTILSDLNRQGHEIALHFHEDAHLGQNPEKLPPDTWCAVMKEEIEILRQASGVDRIRYWSGGNLYPRLFDAAQCAGLDVNSDWKNPRTQSGQKMLTGLQPWRPAGGTDGVDFSRISTHDPLGKIIFLPEGIYARADYAHVRREQGSDAAYFEFLKQSLLASVAAAQPGKVNVFHFNIHPGEFRSGSVPFEVIERFLAEVVDPLAASGKLRWATFSEMADAYRAWELVNPGASPLP